MQSIVLNREHTRDIVQSMFPAKISETIPRIVQCTLSVSYFDNLGRKAKDVPQVQVIVFCSTPNQHREDKIDIKLLIVERLPR